MRSSILITCLLKNQSMVQRAVMITTDLENDKFAPWHGSQPSWVSTRGSWTELSKACLKMQKWQSLPDIWIWTPCGKMFIFFERGYHFRKSQGQMHFKFLSTNANKSKVEPPRPPFRVSGAKYVAASKLWPGSRGSGRRVHKLRCPQKSEKTNGFHTFLWPTLSNQCLFSLIPMTYSIKPMF